MACFPCGQWLCSTRGDGKTSRTLLASAEAPTQDTAPALAKQASSNSGLAEHQGVFAASMSPEEKDGKEEGAEATKASPAEIQDNRDAAQLTSQPKQLYRIATHTSTMSPPGVQLIQYIFVFAQVSALL